MGNYLIQSAKYFYHRRIRRQHYLTARDTVYDLQFRFLIEDALGRGIYKRGSLSPEHADFILGLPFQDGDVLLDIGANIGWFSFVLEKHIPKDIRVFAFEPEPLNYSLLEENREKNNSTRVTTVPYAVSDRVGTATMFLYDPKNTGRHSLLDINKEFGQQVEVKTVVLDDFLQEKGIPFSAVKFVKIDIEGYEYIALRGARKLLEQLPYMFMEYSPDRIAKGGDDPAAFIRWLAETGFRFYSIDSGIARELSVDNLVAGSAIENIFLAKEGYAPVSS